MDNTVIVSEIRSSGPTEVSELRPLDQPTSGMVSILIPTYNGSAYLWETLLSVASQTYTHLEIIICDDASTDATLEMALAFAATDHRVRVFSTTENLGLAGNFKQIYTLARGDYIKYLLQDDLLLSNAIARLVLPLEQIPSITISTSSRRLVDTETRFVATEVFFETEGQLEGRDAATALCVNGINFIGEPSTAMFRRRDIDVEDIGSYHGCNFNWLIDVPTWLSLLERGGLSWYPEPLSCFRIHPAQASRRNIDVAQRDWLNLLTLATEHLDLNAAQTRQALGNLITSTCRFVPTAETPSVRVDLIETVLRALSQAENTLENAHLRAVL